VPYFGPPVAGTGGIITGALALVSSLESESGGMVTAGILDDSKITV